MAILAYVFQACRTVLQGDSYYLLPVFLSILLLVAHDSLCIPSLILSTMLQLCTLLIRSFFANALVKGNSYLLESCFSSEIFKNGICSDRVIVFIHYTHQNFLKSKICQIMTSYNYNGKTGMNVGTDESFLKLKFSQL